MQIVYSESIKLSKTFSFKSNSIQRSQLVDHTHQQNQQQPYLIYSVLIMFNNKMAHQTLQKLNRQTDTSQLLQKDFKVTFSYVSPSNSAEKAKISKTIDLQEITNHKQRKRLFFDEQQLEQQKNGLDAKNLSKYFYYQRPQQSHNALIRKYEQVQTFYKQQKILVKLKLTKNQHDENGVHRLKKISIKLNEKSQKQQKNLPESLKLKTQQKNIRSISRAIIHLHPSSKKRSNSPKIITQQPQNSSYVCLKSWTDCAPKNIKTRTLEKQQTPTKLHQGHSKKYLKLFSTTHHSPIQRKINCKVLFSPTVRKRILEKSKSKENFMISAQKNPIQKIKQKMKKNQKKRIQNRKKKVVSRQKLDKKLPIRVIKTLGD